MLKLTKTGIGLLTKQYRSVLRKCFLLNLGLFLFMVSNIVFVNKTYAGTALGSGALADGLDAVAVGENAVAGSFSATAIGAGANASVWASTALGQLTTASKEFSVAVGREANASANYSVALGGASVANQEYTVSVGSSSIKRRIVNVAAGTGDNDVVIVSQMNSAISSAISGYATQSWVTGKGYLTSVATVNIANGAVTDAKIASGITASKITQTSSYRFVTDAEKSTWNAKQNALSTAQLNAVNSGITAAKVSTYDGYATTIAGKADKATTLSGYGITNAYTKTETDSAISQAISGFVTNDVQSLNYYYTFRNDKTVESAEFALFLNNAKLSSVFEA